MPKSSNNHKPATQPKHVPLYLTDSDSCTGQPEMSDTRCIRPFNAYLKAVASRLAALKADECKDFVHYGAVLGQGSFAKHPRDITPRPTNCSFKLVLLGQFMDDAGEDAAVTTALRWMPKDRMWLVPLNADRLPFTAQRRNVKVLTTLGHMLFPWTRRLLWFDGKLGHGRLGAQRFYTAASQYAARLGAGADTACTVFVGLPKHQYGFGVYGENGNFTLAAHAQTILDVGELRGARTATSRWRPTVTDSPDAIIAQMRTYGPGASNMLDVGWMADTAYFVRDMASERCRAFNAALGCAWMAELACFSDRDQLSFPWVLHRKLGLRPRTAPRTPPPDRQPPVPRFRGFRTGNSTDRHGPWVLLGDEAWHWYHSDRLAISA